MQGRRGPITRLAPSDWAAFNHKKLLSSTCPCKILGMQRDDSPIEPERWLFRPTLAPLWEFVVAFWFVVVYWAVVLVFIAICLAVTLL